MPKIHLKVVQGHDVIFVDVINKSFILQFFSFDNLEFIVIKYIF